MSGLARLLAGHTEPGVYHWTSAEKVDDIQRAVEHAGWRCVVLDTWKVEDKDEFLDACSAAFDFSPEVAHNFDAMADALGDVRGQDGSGVVVLWDGWAPLARAGRRTFDVALGVFGDRVDNDRGGAFAVLLRGPGPTDTDLPELDPRQH